MKDIEKLDLVKSTDSETLIRQKAKAFDDIMAAWNGALNLRRFFNEVERHIPLTDYRLDPENSPEQPKYRNPSNV